MAWTTHAVEFEFEAAPSGQSVFVTKTFDIKANILEEIGVTISQSNM